MINSMKMPSQQPGEDHEFCYVMGHFVGLAEAALGILADGSLDLRGKRLAVFAVMLQLANVNSVAPNAKRFLDNLPLKAARLDKALEENPDLVKRELEELHQYFSVARAEAMKDYSEFATEGSTAG